MINKESLNYIINFLIGLPTDNYDRYVMYGSQPDGTPGTVFVLSSGFFDEDIYGTEKSMPEFPLAAIDGVPLLFGEPLIEKNDRQVIIHGDIVASTYFLITRYEEMIQPDVRDKYGRFPGIESLPSRAGFIRRPIVEEYGVILRQCMREVGVNIPEPVKGFSNIYLTHDVDIPWEHFTLYSAIRRILGETFKRHNFTLYPLKNILGFPKDDPRYTFDELINADRSVPEARSIYFVKSTGYLQPEDCVPYIRKKETKKLIRLLKESDAELGYHVSFEAGKHPQKITEELKVLRDVLSENTVMSRNHYLASLEPRDFYYLLDNGITDDFTMGYADQAGFRLGTCRVVRWIDPENGRLTNLRLHPLDIMDGTLYAKQYMNLDEEASYGLTEQIIQNVYTYGGDLCLLWHNNETVGKDSLNWRNYKNSLDLIKTIRENNSTK